ncbi:hypothetical protein F7725_023268 [Dissostichus mawsoni]|uniref:A-kinase-interacting protein 1 n=1 Tax=Dissostichus mawsoni TaxID=36200 RepID=A0A7J5Z168_DISMA|nr:hypothetical protein F7725_023268 [Dissostichus mawsoni]
MFMESHAWLESSLRRSASLGLEVLQRASRRSVDWSSVEASQTPTTTTEEDTQIPVKRPRSELDDVFATIADFMAQTTHQCKRFYESGSCTEPSDTERSHVCRFHSQPAAWIKTPARSARKHERAPQNQVSPGTYAVTASMPESQQQTQMISVRAGESVDLTFNL